ncbi:MAG: LptF/LptG family permease [Flavobacterium sp.]|nr:LptF/LptG family permease [Flavobacterium sp.]
MKILDKYLLKTFLITFTTVFVILFFIFILQTVWLFIAELAGKDLDLLLVCKFLLFSMPRIIPLVLPLSVLLSSIMTFGSLSENYEFAAMKSAGISLQRAMKSLTIFILILSLISFIFANNVIPYAEFKFINFRRNIAQVQPAMAISEGQFSTIGSYAIKVDKKSGENGNFLSGVTIHKKMENGGGNTTVIKSQKGELVSSKSSNILKLVLTDGNYYEDIIPSKYEDRAKIPFAKATFKKDVINIDLSKLNKTNMENVDISNTSTMQNIHELGFTLDSLNKSIKKDVVSNSINLYQRVGMNNISYIPPDKDKITFSPDLLKDLNKDRQNYILKIASSNVDNTNFSIDSSIIEMDAKQKNINSHWIALYDKFMIAFSCLLMFFIGAPLGAIIRKGGLGLPIVFAVTIFIIFHFINTFGKRVAQENGMPAFLGVWMSSLILTPLAILLTYRAIKDIGGTISFDVITDPIQKLFSRFFKKNIQINVQ